MPRAVQEGNCRLLLRRLIKGARVNYYKANRRIMEHMWRIIQLFAEYVNH
jgi:hypothetical protein